MSFQVSTLLTREEERASALLWQRDRNPEGVRRLVEGNHRFVMAQAMTYVDFGVELDDLVSEGTLGLIEAAKRFDPERPVRFLSFAGIWVRGAMGRALAKTGHAIVIPPKPRRLLRKLIEVETRLGAEATTERLVQELGIEVDQVEYIQSLKGLQSSSMDQPLGEDAGFTLAAQIPADLPSAQDLVCEGDLQSAMRLALARLPERTRRILEMHFGFTTGTEMTLDQIADLLGVSRQRISQIKQAGIKRLARNRALKNH